MCIRDRFLAHSELPPDREAVGRSGSTTRGQRRAQRYEYLGLRVERPVGVREFEEAIVVSLRGRAGARPRRRLFARWRGSWHVFLLRIVLPGCRAAIGLV